MVPQAKKKNTMLMVVIGIWVGVFLGGLVLVILALTGAIPSVLDPLANAGQSITAVQENTPAPEFDALDSSGNVVRLVDLRGQVVVLNYWATWCGPCIREVPMFRKYHEQYPNFVMLGVNQGESLADIAKFREEYGMTYETLVDPGQDLSELYQVMLLPTTFFIDETGMIRYRHVGFMSENQFRYYLQQLGVVE